MASMRMTNPGPRALAFGEDTTTTYFEGRRGHGSAPASKVVLYQSKLSAMLALAYQRGRDEAKLPELKIKVKGDF